MENTWAIVGDDSIVERLTPQEMKLKAREYALSLPENSIWRGMHLNDSLHDGHPFAHMQHKPLQGSVE